MEINLIDNYWLLSDASGLTLAERKTPEKTGAPYYTNQPYYPKFDQLLQALQRIHLYNSDARTLQELTDQQAQFLDRLSDRIDYIQQELMLA